MSHETLYLTYTSNPNVWKALNCIFFFMAIWWISTQNFCRPFPTKIYRAGLALHMLLKARGSCDLITFYSTDLMRASYVLFSIGNTLDEPCVMVRESLYACQKYNWSNVRNPLDNENVFISTKYVLEQSDGHQSKCNTGARNGSQRLCYLVCADDFSISCFHFVKLLPHQQARISPSAFMDVSWTQTARQNSLFKNTAGSVFEITGIDSRSLHL